MISYAVVHKENALCLINEINLNQQYPSLEVLYGRRRFIHDSIINCASPEEWRFATLGDFDEFGVHYNKSYKIHESTKHDQLT